MLDVLVAGAGPAGAIVALVLARAGARVLVVDRDEFPRDKLCGDTLNPGAVARLTSLGLTGGPLDRGLPLRGMLVTGPTASIVGRYGGAPGVSVRRLDLDQWLLSEAVAAGARFEPGMVVREPLIDVPRGLVRGARISPRRGGAGVRMPALMTIAADGRRSILARRLGLSHPPSVRRWAFGTYAEDVPGMSDLGEMHIGRDAYIGLAPIGPNLVNVCVVTPARPPGGTPTEVMRHAIARNPRLAERLADVRFDPRVRVLGPLAADVSGAGTAGLLLAGDAAGFIDPMTGDGLNLAIQGAVLAAEETLRTLVSGDFAGAVDRLATARRRAFGRKLGFNRLMQRVVGRPAALGIASRAASLAPGLIRQAVNYAGDVP